MLAERGHKVAAMIELDVPEDELMKRLLLRGQMSGRSDDNEETIKKRLDVYHNQTSPLIDEHKINKKCENAGHRRTASFRPASHTPHIGSEEHARHRHLSRAAPRDDLYGRGTLR